MPFIKNGDSKSLGIVKEAQPSPPPVDTADKDTKHTTKPVEK